MERPTRILILAVAALAGPASAPTAAADDVRQVVVVVDNRAGAGPAVLDQAAKHAAGIHRAAGIKMTWRGHEERPDLFTVRLIIQDKFRGTSGVASKLLMGAAPESAFECGGMAYLFYDQITAFSNLQRLDVSMVLGTVAAHEVGHVLMRRAGHSAEGVMRASWTADDWQRSASGSLLFSPAERHAMHGRISACSRQSGR